METRFELKIIYYHDKLLIFPIYIYKYKIFIERTAQVYEKYTEGIFPKTNINHLTNILTI